MVSVRTFCSDKQQNWPNLAVGLSKRQFFSFIFYLIGQLMVFKNLKLDDFSSTLARFWLDQVWSTALFLGIVLRVFFLPCLHDSIQVDRLPSLCLMKMVSCSCIPFLWLFLVFTIWFLWLSASHLTSLCFRSIIICEMMRRKLMRQWDIFSEWIALQNRQVYKVSGINTYRPILLCFLTISRGWRAHYCGSHRPKILCRWCSF